MRRQFFICSDPDRTLLPNGPQEESPGARDLLHVPARRPEITLVYVSGRNLHLLQKAIEDYKLPEPDYAVGDAGTTIYRAEGGTWRPLKEWENDIAPDRQGRTGDQLAGLHELK